MFKVLQIAGASFSVIGSILVGLLSQGGIPKKGDPIRAPNRLVSVVGWILIIFGFLVSLVLGIFQ